ncbi:MAG: peptide chain release factor N(5)-glutamine methyltransferase [Vicinamibacterales bacterium]
MTTLAAWADAARRTLAARGWPDDEARRDASRLARAVLGWDAATWIAHGGDGIPPAFEAAAGALLERRLAHEPLAYLTGAREFYGRDFAVTPAVLIPRPETEGVVEEALRIATGRTGAAAGNLAILDAGTGSGCLAITLALELPAAALVATDVSPEALGVARRNAAALGVADRIEFLQAPLAAGLDAAVDLVVANPPYVPERDRPALAPDVVGHEPALALFAGPDGLDVIRDLVPAARHALRAGGSLVMEIGAGQAEAVEALFGREWHEVGIVPDLQGIPRVVVARLPGA